jgi:acyl-CoA dehydrogenase
MTDRQTPHEPDARSVRAFLEERHVELAHRIGDFVAEQIAPLPPPADDAAARTQARVILGLLGNAGWLRAAHPLDLRACCMIRESLASASSLADEVFALQALGSLPIALSGSAELRDRWLPGTVSGKQMAAFAMTEPEAGSDVASIATHAVRDGKDYVINGQKTLISNAGIADFYTLFAKTDPAAGHRGISCFVIDANTPGLELVGALALSAPHPLGDLALAGCRVPEAQRIGGEGEGFKLGMATLDALRATVAASACGMARRALDEAMRHALSRRQFGSVLADFQAVQLKLARMATDLAAARLLVYRAAAAKDRGAERVTLESAMAKAFATEAAQRIIDDAVQIVGGRGVLADHPVDRLYRAIRPLRIYEGTTDIQHLVIARTLLKAASES